MAGRDGLQRRLQVGEWLDVVDLCCRDQRGDAGPGATVFVVPRKQSVLSGERDRADEVFHGVGVDLDAAVGEEGLQAGLLAVDIGQLLTEARFRRDPQSLCLQPVTEFGHEGCGSGGRTGAGRGPCLGSPPRCGIARRSDVDPRRRARIHRDRRPLSACGAHVPSSARP